MDRTFIKDVKGPKELLNIWRGRGLQIEDDAVAYQALQRIGYYRLSGFCLPFLTTKSPSSFNKGTSLKQILELYSFDTELRSLTSQALEKLEIAIRSSICEFMGSKSGPHWYTKQDSFVPGKFSALLDEAASKLDFNLQQNIPYRPKPEDIPKKGRQLFLDHYYARYDDPPMPPCWMLRELSTFGFWARVFESLNVGDQKQISMRWTHPDGKRIDHELLASWLWSISILRNRCAHHTRITDQRFSYPPKLPAKNPSRTLFYDKTDDLHTLLVIILILLNCSALIDYDFRGKLLHLFHSYKSVNIARATGFSLETKSTWEETVFWTFEM